MLALRITLPIICVLYALAAFLLTIGLGGIVKPSAIDKESSDEWLFTNGFEKLYDALFPNEDPIALSKAFGLEYDKYMVDCKILGRTPNFPREAMMRVTGVFAFILSLFITILLMNPIPIVIGCIVYILLASAIPRKVHSDAMARKSAIIHDLSRFVDLFLSALEADFPIEIAIMATADNLPGILSEELKAAMVETQLGAKNWQQALESIAQKYEADALSDFVVNIITSYNKGVSVTEAVARQAYDIKQSSILIAREETAKMNNVILAPVTLLKLIPLLLILGIPLVMQATSLTV